MQTIAIIKIKTNIIIWRILKKPRSFVFLNNSRSCPAIALKPDVEPVGDNSKPIMVAITPTINNMIVPQSIMLVTIIYLFIN